MTLGSYFGRQNSTLGSVVPLAMFVYIVMIVVRYMPFHRTMLSGTEWESAGLPYHIFALHTIWNREQVFLSLSLFLSQLNAVFPKDSKYYKN